MNDATKAAPTKAAEPDFYRPHTFKKKGPCRRETRDFLRSKGRFVKMEKGDAPMTREAMQMFFQPRESPAATQERARKAHAAREAARAAGANKKKKVEAEEKPL